MTLFNKRLNYKNPRKLKDLIVAMSNFCKGEISTIASEKRNSFNDIPNGSLNGSTDKRRMPLLWREGVYGNDSFFKELFEYQKKWIPTLIDKNTSFVDVGCGHCEMGAVLYEQARYCVQVDINPFFLDLAREIHPTMTEHPTSYILEGGATELKSVIEKSVPPDFWSTKRLVCQFMNTLCVVDREASIAQMLEVAGPTGTVVIGCWHSESLESAVTGFYGRIQEYCGDINQPGVVLDLTNNRFFIPPSYDTHWFSESELRSYVDESRYQLEFQVVSVGIFMIITPKGDTP